MIIRRHRSRFARLVARSAVVWAILGAIAWLDRGRQVPAQHAGFFVLIWGAIEAVASIVGEVGAIIAASLEAVVGWCVSAIGWLATRVADILTNSGAMFAKVWEGARAVWQDAIRPALQWIHDWYLRIRDWLTKVFQPVFDFLGRVKAELLSLYKRFVQPVLDALNVTRAVLDILAKLHVPFAAALEGIVTDIEQTIAENYLRLIGYVNQVISTLNGLVTLDGLLQRFVFLRTLERDAFYVWRVMVNSGTRTVSAADHHQIVKKTQTATPDEFIGLSADWWNGNGGDFGASMDARVADAASFWNEAG